GRITKFEFRGALRNLFNHWIVNSRIDYRTRARRAFLSLEAKGRLHDAGRGLVEVCIVSHDDCIFATHFGDHAFDPELAIMNLRPSFVDAQTNLFRSREGDKARLRMI